MVPSPSAHEPLCVDVPIGRIVNRVDHYLSLNVDFYQRLAEFHTGGLQHVEHKFGLSGGPVLELSVQVVVRPLTPWCVVIDYVNDLHQLGDPGGPWPLDRFRPAPGVALDAVLRLAELCRKYNHNLKDPQAIDSPTRAVFIPREVEQEIRDIAAQLRGGNGRSISDDTR